MRHHWSAGRRALAAVLTAALAGCAGAQPPRVLPALVLGEPSFFPTIEAYAAAPIVGGNRVEVLLNGEQIFPAVRGAIDAARTTITYAQPTWEDGPVARDLVGALASRCRAGVQVNVLLDAVGAGATPASHVELLRASGCQVAHVRPDDEPAGRRNNRRILVVDGLVAFTGSSGVGRSWMGNGRLAGHWRDTDVRVEGPAVEQLQGAFAESWLEATGIVLGGPAYFPRPRRTRGPVYAHVVRSSPAAGTRTIYTTILLAIASARRSVSITGPALRPDDPLANALVAAVRRGVRVRALVPDAEHAGTGPWARAELRRLRAAGVQVYAYQPARLNARTIVIDGVWATVGSFILDHRTFARTDEVNLVVYNAAVSERLQQAFLGDLAHARLLEAETVAGGTR